MDSKLKLTTIIFIFCSTPACDGGNTNSGGDNATPTPAIKAPPETITKRGEFAVDCLDNIQVRTNRTAVVQNICGYSINVNQTNSRLTTPSPVTEIAAGQLVAVALSDDSLTIRLGACRAPPIPESSSPGFFTCSDITIQNSKRKSSNEFLEL